MTGNEQTHPQAEMLAAFAQGRLEDDVAVPIADHLATCAVCRQALRAIPDDHLLALLRPGASTPLPHPDLLDLPATQVDAGSPAELTDHPRYRLLQRLGSGGMGVVYKAEHRQLDRTVALKVISKQWTASAAVVERFRREMQAVARLSHPNLVQAHDADQAGDLHFLVMEYIEGINLAALVERDGPLPVEKTCDCVRQAALGLAHAWKQGLVHRDVKPHNLMLTPEGQVKVIDFGLASIASEQRREDGLTGAHEPMGTPDYMAPEQIRDARSADTRADIYSLGCTLYFLLTGRPPFPEGNSSAKMAAHLERQPEPLAALCPGLAPDLVRLTERMMAKDPAARFQTPQEVATALEPFCRPRQERPTPRRRWWRWGLAAVLLLAVAGMVGWVMLPHPPRPSPQMRVICDADWPTYAGWMQGLDSAHFTPTYVHVHDAGGIARHTCIAVRKDQPWRWHVYHGPDQTGDIPKNMQTPDCRPLCGTGYRNDGMMHYASVWHLDRRVAASLAFYPTAAEYQAHLLAEMEQKQRWPAQLSGYPTPNGCGFAIVWERAEGTSYQVRHDLTAEEYQPFLEGHRAEGYRPVSVSAYPHEGRLLFTAVLLQDKQKPDWKPSEGLSADRVREENEHMMTESYRPLVLSGYWQDNASRYLAVWVKDRPIEPPLPEKGNIVPGQ